METCFQDGMDGIYLQVSNFAFKDLKQETMDLNISKIQGGSCKVSLKPSLGGWRD